MTAELTQIINQMPTNLDDSETNMQLQLLQSYNALPVRRVEDIVAMDNRVSLSRMALEHDDIKINAILYIIVNDLVNFFNVGKTMTPQQVASTVVLIREEFPHFSIEDFKLAFTRAKKGELIKIYDRIDGSIIFDLLHAYSEERWKAFAVANEKRDNIHKSPKRERIGITVSDPQSIKEAASKEFNAIIAEKPKYLSKTK